MRILIALLALLPAALSAQIPPTTDPTAAALLRNLPVAATGQHLRPVRDEIQVRYFPYVPAPGSKELTESVPEEQRYNKTQGFMRFIPQEDATDDQVFVQFFDNAGGDAVWAALLTIPLDRIIGYTIEDMARQTQRGIDRDVRIEGDPGSTEPGAILWAKVETGDVAVQLYSRSKSGFIADLSDYYIGGSPTYELPIVNPGSNHKIKGVARYVNPTDKTLELVVIGKDDRNKKHDEQVGCTIPPYGAVTLYTEQAEDGSFPDTTPCEGSLGDGTGKWRISSFYPSYSEAKAYLVMGGLLSAELGIFSNLTWVPSHPVELPP